MNFAVRALEGFVGAGTLLFTIAWGVLELQRFGEYRLFVSEVIPFPLLLPLLAGILTIINIELFIALMTPDNDDDVMLTKTEKQIGGTVVKQSKKITKWNSRLDQKEQK